MGPCLPWREMCPASEVCVPEESNRPGAAGVHFGTCCPPNFACASPSVSKFSFQEFAPKTFFFRSSPLNLWARTEIRSMRFHRALPSYECASSIEICAPKGGKRPVSTGRNLIGMSTFFLYSRPNLRVKLSVLPLLFFLPPPPQLRYSGAGPGGKCGADGAAHFTKIMCKAERVLKWQSTFAMKKKEKQTMFSSC